MEIKTLLKAFEDLLPIYEKAYKAKLMSFYKFSGSELDLGICHAADSILKIPIYEEINTHYRHYIDEDKRLFNYPKTNKDLKPRIDFLKQEIPYLKGLIKKGYTHI